MAAAPLGATQAASGAASTKAAPGSVRTSTSVVPRCRSAFATAFVTAARVAELRTAAIRPVSLDAPVGEEHDAHLFGEIIEDKLTIEPETAS